MDTYDIHFLNSIINDYKNGIKNRFSKIHMNHKDLKNNSDDLCLIWDYTPKIADEKKIKEKYKIKQEVFDQNNNNIELSLIKSKTFVVNDSFVKENMTNSTMSDKDHNDQIINKEENYFKNEHKANEKSIENAQNKKGSKIIFHSSVFQTDKNDLNNKFDSKEENTSKKLNFNTNLDSGKEESENPINKDEVDCEQSTKTENNELNNVPVRKHRLTENANLRVYLFNTQNYIDVQVFFGENISALKKKILSILKLRNYSEIFQLSKMFNFSSNLLIRKSDIEDNEIENIKNEENPLYYLIKDHINSELADAYEIRHVEEDDDFKPNLDFPAFEDKKSAVNTRIHTVCIIQKLNFDPNERKKQVKLGYQENGKLLINIFVKVETERNESESEFSTKVEEDSFKTLSDLFERIKNKLLTNKINNFDYFNFYEHDNEGSKKKNPDFLDNVYKELPMDFKLKDLKSFELDVSLHIF